MLWPGSSANDGSMRAVRRNGRIAPSVRQRVIPIVGQTGRLAAFYPSDAGCGRASIVGTVEKGPPRIEVASAD